MGYTLRGRAEVIYNTPVDSFATTHDIKTVSAKYAVHGIDATAATTVVVGTTDASSTAFFHPTSVTVIATTITAHTSVASISVGITGAAFTDILANTAQTGLTVTGKYLRTSAVAAANARVAGSSAITAKFNTNAVGTVETYSIIVDGFYEDYAGQTYPPAG